MTAVKPKTVRLRLYDYHETGASEQTRRVEVKLNGSPADSSDSHLTLEYQSDVSIVGDIRMLEYGFKVGQIFELTLVPASNLEPDVPATPDAEANK